MKPEGLLIMSDAKTPEPVKVEQHGQPPAQQPASRPDTLWQPFSALREEVDRLFDNVWRGFGGSSPTRMQRQPAEAQPLWRLDTAFGMVAPMVDVTEGEKEFRISAELPGMSTENVELVVNDDMLTIRGEKKEEKEEKAENYHRSERRFGSFQRSFQLPRGVDRDRIEAKFDKGVLQVTLPKTAEAAARQKRIEISQG
jgi:HSP20 family protein